MSALPSHWLVKAAAAADLIRPEQIMARAGTPALAIWEEIERTSGVGEAELVTRIAARLRMNVAALTPQPSALRVIPEKVAMQHNVLPWAMGAIEAIEAIEAIKNWHWRVTTGTAGGTRVRCVGYILLRANDFSALLPFGTSIAAFIHLKPPRFSVQGAS